MALSFVTVKESFGLNSPPVTILSSALFITSLFFYAYFAGSFFQVTIHPLIDRINYSVVFDQHVTGDYTDSLILLAVTTLWLFSLFPKGMLNKVLVASFGSFALMCSVISLFASTLLPIHIATLVTLPLMTGIILFYHAKHQGQLLNFKPKLTAAYLSIVIAALAIGAIVLAMPSIFLGKEYSYLGRESNANELFLLLSSFSSILMMLIVFCVPVKMLFDRLVSALGFRKPNQENVEKALAKGQRETHPIKKRMTALLLVSFMLISVAMALIPQLETINPDNQNIGVDSKYYVTWLTNLANSPSISDFIYQSFVSQGNGDRPLSIVLVFAIHQLAGGTPESLTETIEHLPVILGPGIVLALYFLTNEFTDNSRIALLAAFLGAVSFHTLIGIYAGLYANWLSLIVGFASMIFLFRYLKNGGHTDAAVFFGLMVATMFFHVYTWTMMAAVAGIFLVVMLMVPMQPSAGSSPRRARNFFERRRTLLALAIVISTVGIDGARALLTGTSVGIEQDAEIANITFGLDQFDNRWDNVDETMHQKLGGIFGNSIILGLVSFWVLKFASKEPVAIFLMIYFSLGLVTLFFGAWSVQSRVLYNIPFEIPAAIAIWHIAEKSKSSGSIRLAPLMWLTAIAIITVTNFYFIGKGGVG